MDQEVGLVVCPEETMEMGHRDRGIYLGKTVSEPWKTIEEKVTFGGRLRKGMFQFEVR